MDLLTIEKKEKRRKHYWLFLVATYDEKLRCRFSVPSNLWTKVTIAAANRWKPFQRYWLFLTCHNDAMKPFEDSHLKTEIFPLENKELLPILHTWTPAVFKDQENSVAT